MLKASLGAFAQGCGVDLSLLNAYRAGARCAGDGRVAADEKDLEIALLRHTARVGTQTRGQAG